MWVLDNTKLPTVGFANPTAPPLVFLETGASLAPLFAIDLQADYALPGTQQFAAPTAVAAVTNSTNTISVGSLTQIDAIAIGPTIYTPALIPSNPRPGEFVIVGGNAVLTPLRSIPSGLPALILGGTQIVPTDYIDPSILEVFKGLPVEASLNWSMSAETHPTGSINLIAFGDANLAIVDQRFKKGSELIFAGIGFVVTNYSKKLENTHDNPGRKWTISVSLGGKWEREHYQNPAFLVPSANPPRFDGQPYTDPDCRLGSPLQPFTRLPTRVSVSQLAERVDAAFVGFSSASTKAEIYARVGLKPFPVVVFMAASIVIPRTPPLDVWSVPIPRDLPRGATGTWYETADSLKRQNGCFMDFSNPSAIYARDINSGNRWSYSVAALQINYKGDTENSPGIEGYGFQFQAAKLTGQFSEPANQDNSSQNNSQGNWKRRDARVRYLKSGTMDANIPPANLSTIRNMGLNWDTSGPTQEYIEVMTVDGVEMLKTRNLYGLQYTSDQVTQDPLDGTPMGANGEKHGPVIANAAPFWRLVQQDISETQYDYTTRYITGTKATGAKQARYKQETDGLELLSLSRATDSDSQYAATLYRFQQIPSYSIGQKVLQQLASFYGDVQMTPVPSEMVKRCAPDGSSVMVSVRDPNFVEPMFETASLDYTNSFAHTKNPDSTPTAPLPDLTMGEERVTEKSLNIVPSNSTEVRTNDKNYKFKTDEDLYLTYDSEFSIGGPNFSEVVAKRTFATNVGRPGQAQRLPDAYEKEENEQKSGNPNIYKNPQEAFYEYVLCTPNNDPNEPSVDSISFDKASYLHQGIVGAESTLKYEDIQKSVGYQATIPTNFQVRPMDYLQLFDGVTTHLTRVISVENSIYIEGSLNGYPFSVTPSNTAVTAGIDRTIPITITKHPKMGSSSFDSRVFGLTIGKIIPPTLETRGNY